MYSRVVYVDVETTGLNWNDQIIQLGALDDKGEKFNVYMMPNVKIDERAAAVNGKKLFFSFFFVQFFKCQINFVANNFFIFFAFLSSKINEKLICLLKKFVKKILFENLKLFKNFFH